MRFLLVVFTLACLCGCKKPDERSCWKFRGEESTLTIPVSADKFIIESKLNVQFIQDSTDVIILKGGENLLKLVEVETSSDGTVTLRNRNKCNFLRKEGSLVDVEVHLTSLTNVLLTGSDRISGKVKSDYLTLVIDHGSGTIDMDIEALAVNARSTQSYGDFILRGTTQSGEFVITSNGYCDTYGLVVSDTLKFFSNSVGNMRVNANGSHVKGTLKSSGNLFYIGVPASMDILKTGSGSVIKTD